MQLACNYSPALMDLLFRNGAAVDYIKAGAFGLYLDKLDAMRALLPVLLHGMGKHERAGMPDYRALDFERMDRLLRQYGSPHLGIHMGITRADGGGELTEQGIHDRMAGCVAHFQQNLSVPVLLENTGDTPEERAVYDLVPFVLPEQIGRLLAETGAGLLLDIAHAKVTAQYRGWNLLDYLSDLPLHQVREIHITGTGFDVDGNPYDAHGPMEAADYDALAWVLARSRPEFVTLEYGYPAGFGGPSADIKILCEQLHRIKSILG